MLPAWVRRFRSSNGHILMQIAPEKKEHFSARLKVSAAIPGGSSAVNLGMFRAEHFSQSANRTHGLQPE